MFVISVNIRPFRTIRLDVKLICIPVLLLPLLCSRIYFSSEAPSTYVHTCTYYITIIIWDFNQGFPICS